ncbi:MAG: recombinase family protein [Defluviitaleaceae bacterium]|nr:recombinase family protein [Defluviitaleaceae bacterium]
MEATTNPLLQPQLIEAQKRKAALYCRLANEPPLLESQGSKVAIYCRVASTHHSDAGAIDIQLVKLRDFAVQQGFGKCREYLDNGYSGNNLNRPAFSKMEADINSGKVDTVIVRCIDRIARDMFLRVMEVLTQAYTHVMPKEKVNAVDKINFLFG